ncbi:PIN domain nuclease of toxin-antitoxin system [Haloactinopolyspora alba]|uniref:PIN domain nuclease of toxin-antitoxin system n=1 Tax=Haloactinopolyspora alba TaxID=648780 RepID=A0A2P8D3A4_9ACTN|nr:type II toxin-antitoxin system VapC family toxin [Haloactinopolyspora alba]PSK91703.1 PIN domain nuclease of toxin-antitoxin system [Haloactinopolyspora alba]
MIVLDSSAILTFLYAEPGHESVKDALESGLVCAANWSETLQKITFHGGDATRQGDLLRLLGLEIEPLTRDDAATAARLFPQTRHAGLSLGDRCCLALAARMGVQALTADRAWADLDIDVQVRLVR